jgi:tetratricopeptide (TPR) repeat protein
MNDRKPLTVALLLAWTAFLLARALPAWIPDLTVIGGLVRSFFKVESDNAGLVYMLIHHSEMTGKAALLHLVLLLSGIPAVRWIAPKAARDRLVAWGLGFGVASLAILGWGLAGLWYPGPVLITLVLLALPEGFRNKSLRRPVSAVREWRAVLPSWRDIPLTAYAGATAVLILSLLAIAPDTSWDSVVYHLRVPAFFVGEHRIFYIPTHHFTAFPLAAEMLYGALMLFGGLERMGGGESAKLIHLSCAVICALGARRIALRLLSVPWGDRDLSPHGWLAFTLVLVGQFAGSIAVRAYNDFVPGALIGIALAILVSGASLDARSRILAGALVGVALSAKYTAVIALACLGPLWFGFRVLPYAAVAVPLVPWLVKNGLFTGNPAAPFLSSIFPSGGPESAFQLKSYAASVGEMSFSPALLVRSASCMLGGAGDDSITELLAILLVPALLLTGYLAPGPTGDSWLESFRALRWSVEQKLVLFLAGFTFLWMVLAPDLRFYSSGLAVFAALAATGYGRAEEAFGRRLRPALLVLLALNLFRLPMVHVRLFDPLPFTFGRETVWDDISRSMYPAPHYGRIAWWANRDLPENARLLLVIDIKAHYLWRRSYHDFQYVRPGLLLRWMRAGGTMDGFLKKLRQEGVTHIFVIRQRTRDVGNHYAWRGGELAMAADFFASHTDAVAKTDLVEVLKVSRTPHPRRSLDGYDWILFTHPENLLIEGKDSEALPLLEETLLRAPWLKGVKAFLGIAYGRSNRTTEAIRVLSEAVKEGGPNAGHSAYVLGQMMRIKGDKKSAERWWREALRIKPDHAEARYNLAGILYERGARKEALAEIDAAVRLAPDNSEYAKARAEIARTQGVP